ncbi:HypC/HybG/HupF family hydrogenase formation chaperone [Xanthobacter dioxanivorans]|uniref:HypC/HybG/HupF family hydrogenase formation chaperone n=1 Tax=Xanthobacter dioxanivorans TaxID=2528964 RepID=A0A974SK33_9HYPH|nr:HypC/HybG/HupF family hydrogenase formation chaperone [Xanthobacter dioxanivorans]QRG07839.1 HypC/HybG/HupF family hydrogenase formation chaperone [Xanthobacter dioxanivorans]
MCLGLPMRVDEVDGTFALCTADGRAERVDLALVPDAVPGDHVLVFQGTARRRMDAQEARLVTEALAGIAAIMAGQADAGLVDRAFADLANREPTLPPHLAAAFAAGRKEA